MTALDLLVKLEEKLQSAPNLEELGQICQVIKARLHELTGFEDWLRCAWKSRHFILTKTKPLTEDDFTKEGREWLKKEGIIL